MFSDKEEKNQTSTSSHNMWPPDCPDKETVELKLHSGMSEVMLSRTHMPESSSSHSSRDMPGLCAMGDHISKETIEKEKSAEYPEIYIWGSRLADIAVRTTNQVRIKMKEERDLNNFKFPKWPDTLGNEAAGQLPCLPMKFPRSLPD